MSDGKAVLVTDDRSTQLPYGRQRIDEDDIAAVVEVLRSDWLTTGPMVERFERAFARRVNAKEAVSVCNGTAALHAAMFALGVGPGEEVIVPAMTFAATANCVVYQGATPVFADVEPDTLLLGREQVEECLTSRTRAIIAVDYTGQPCDYRALRELASRHRLALVADASHSLGGSDRGKPVGCLADLSTFSLHAVKPITAGEGGMVTTDNVQLAGRMRRFRNHGFTRDHHERTEAHSWHYSMTELGHNYRLTDIQSALGLSQLAKLDGWAARRREIAGRYDEAFSRLPGTTRLTERRGVSHARHLYVIRVEQTASGHTRAEVFAALRERRLGVGVHYIPVHLHPFYQERFATRRGMCPVAEAAYEEILSLPIFPAMTDDDIEYVIASVCDVVAG